MLIKSCLGRFFVEYWSVIAVYLKKNSNCKVEGKGKVVDLEGKRGLKRGS